ncbi:MAG: G-D-S-L family lipolytic protein [Bacteroidetes bacterium]|nr:G-D-S-L family lipolytic protein [Bacteroidota bacterium]
MKNTFKYIALAAVVGFTSCEPEFENTVTDTGFYDTGSADLSNYVAVGNSLTAGFADGALYISGQNNSYPNIMAGQFALAGAGENFTQPLMSDDLGGLLLGGVQVAQNKFVLSAGANGPFPAVLEGTPTTEVGTSATGPFNNMGVPGAKSFHLVTPGYGQLNPYFGRFATSGTATVVGDAASLNASFFSLWIGNNDILSFATSGGLGVDQTGNLDPATYGPNDITDPNVFAASYSGILDALMAGGAEGMVVNLPDVTSIPFFTTVPFAPLDPSNPDFAAQIPTLNATYAQLNQAFAFLGVSDRSIFFNSNGPSPVVVHDESLADVSESLTQVLIAGGLDVPTATIFGLQFGQARQANADDLLTLTSSSAIAALNTDRMAALMALGLPEASAAQLSVNGLTYPMEDQWVLIPAEQTAIANANNAYNATIEALADARNLILIDARGELAEIAATGVDYPGGVLTSQFVTGGGFSLDGVHPTARGYAYVANLAIERINRKYNANIPTVEIGNYPTVQVHNNGGGN